MSDLVTVESEGFTVTTNSGETAEQLTENLKSAEQTPEPEKPEPEPEPAPATDPKLAKAAAKLGSEGGKATAAKRAEAKAAQEAEAEGVAEAEEKPGEEKLGKPRHDAKARMLEATREAAELKRERERLAAKVAELEAKIAPPKEPAKEPEKSGKPKAEDYDSYEDFVDARAEYKAREIIETARREQAEQAKIDARHDGIKQAAKTFYGRVSEAAKADPTFTDRTAGLAATLTPSFLLAPGQQLQAANVLADEVIRSEQAPALMLHFEEHPEDRQRIEALPTVADVQVEVRFLAKSLAAAPLAPAPKAEVSQARPPVRPVTGAPHAADTVPGDDASYEAHKAYWDRKEREQAARR